MIRYTYTQFTGVPAPFVHVTLRCPETGRQAENVPAQVDTGSDRTILPTGFADALGLVQLGRQLVAGLGGQIVETPLYGLDLTIRGLQPLSIRVLTHPGEPHVLLGRDVLNCYRILLDGPGRALEIG